MCSIKNREKNVTSSAANPYVQDLWESARILCLARWLMWIDKKIQDFKTKTY